MSLLFFSFLIVVTEGAYCNTSSCMDHSESVLLTLGHRTSQKLTPEEWSKKASENMEKYAKEWEELAKKYPNAPGVQDNARSMKNTILSPTAVKAATLGMAKIDKTMVQDLRSGNWKQVARAAANIVGSVLSAIPGAVGPLVGGVIAMLGNLIFPMESPVGPPPPPNVDQIRDVIRLEFEKFRQDGIMEHELLKIEGTMSGAGQEFDRLLNKTTENFDADTAVKTIDLVKGSLCTAENSVRNWFISVGQVIEKRMQDLSTSCVDEAGDKCGQGWHTKAPLKGIPWTGTDCHVARGKDWHEESDGSIHVESSVVDPQSQFMLKGCNLDPSQLHKGDENIEVRLQAIRDSIDTFKRMASYLNSLITKLHQIFKKHADKELKPGGEKFIYHFDQYNSFVTLCRMKELNTQVRALSLMTDVEELPKQLGFCKADDWWGQTYKIDPEGEHTRLWQWGTETSPPRARGSFVALPTLFGFLKEITEWTYYNDNPGTEENRKTGKSTCYGPLGAYRKEYPNGPWARWDLHDAWFHKEDNAEALTVSYVKCLINDMKVASALKLGIQANAKFSLNDLDFASQTKDYGILEDGCPTAALVIAVPDGEKHHRWDCSAGDCCTWDKIKETSCKAMPRTGGADNPCTQTCGDKIPCSIKKVKDSC